MLFARMRGAMRTMEELKTFWKERWVIVQAYSPDVFDIFGRAAIEEQYAKRLASLAKATLGRDEIGYVPVFGPILV